MRPLCVKCQTEYRCTKNDVVVEEIASLGSYKLWCADLWECPSCHHQLISGYGRAPYGEHFQDNYGEKLKAAAKHGLFKCVEYKEVVNG